MSITRYPKATLECSRGAQSKRMLPIGILRYFTVSFLLSFQTRKVFPSWRCYGTVFWKLENGLKSWRHESRKLKPFCSFLIKTLEIGVAVEVLVWKKRRQSSPCPIGKSMRGKIRRSKSSRMVRQDRNANKSWLRFQSTARVLTFTVNFTHTNIIAKEIQLMAAILCSFQFSFEDPDTFNTVSAGSQQKLGWRYFVVGFLQKTRMCTTRQDLRVAIQVLFLQRVLKPFDSFPSGTSNHHIYHFKNN